MGTARGKGASIVDVKVEPELEYARHCREADIRTAAFLDCLSYYNGEGNAEPGSLAYYSGPETWRARCKTAQKTLEPHVFEGD